MIDLNVWFLKLSGLWCILKSTKIARKYVISAAFIIIPCQGIYLPMECYKLITGYENFQRTLELLGFALTHILATTKIINLYVNRKEICQIIEDLNSYYIMSDHTAAEECKRLKQRFYKKTYRLGILLFVLGNCAGLIRFGISAFHLVFCTDDTKYEELCRTMQPFLIPLPEFLDMIFLRWVLCVFQGICLNLYAWQIVACDMLFVSLLVHIDCVTHILCYLFETVTERSMSHRNTISDKDSGQQLNSRMNKEINMATYRLQRLITTCEKTSNVYQYVVLMQLVFALFTLMSSLYVATSVPIFGASFIYQLEFYVTIVTQLSLYCWFANEITISFGQIPKAIYNNNWMSGDQSFKKSMIINTIRMNKPIYLVIGMVAPLNLNVCIYILRASYSYFAIIKNK
uniref:Odorant receptor n=1 Tax=Protaetia brevitarsis TaxID=348688 RepID=A0A411HR88_PROBE|nr:odorant receptor [Protaetia brevitarsis]